MMKNDDQLVEIIIIRFGLIFMITLIKILVIGSSGSEKTIVLLNLIKNQWPDIDKSYLYIRGPLESKYQLLNSGRETAWIKNF